MQKVGGSDLVPKRPGARAVVTLAGRRIGLIRGRRDGRIHCLDAICYHMGGPLIQSGDLEDVDRARRQCIVCPWHRYKIDLDSGEGLYQDMNLNWKSKGVKQRVHTVEERPDGIYVELQEQGKVESDGYARRTFPTTS